MAKTDPKPLPELSQKDIEDFYSRISTVPGQGPRGECHEWQTGRFASGYGGFGPRKGIHLKAHRVAYFLATGIDPYPLLVLHRCDNPPCCNPEHLWIGDNKANNDDCVSKGRGKKASGVNHGLHLNPERAARGESNGAAKLTPAIVLDIRQRYATGHYSYAALAREFPNTTPGHVRQIVLRERWRHI